MSSPNLTRAGFRLRTLPGRVFKATSDFNREGLEGWAFFLGVESTVAGTQLEAQELSVALLQVGSVREEIRYDREALVSLANVLPDRLSPEMLPSELSRYWPWVMRLRFIQPQRLQLDGLRLELTLQESNGEPFKLLLDVPLAFYEQKTKLRFPFLGPGIIIQGGVLNDGHRNRSGQFAIDALGLTERYAPESSASNTPEAYAGWERPILAPAAGMIVFARGDRPDQPVVENSDPAFYAPEYPHGGDPGNHVVIDHGNGEYSMLAHFRQDSLVVTTSQQVEQGQPLGLLGNSGDSTGPHVHHQLQAGPDWEYADALPHVYENGPHDHHDRGWYFLAE